MVDNPIVRGVKD